MQSSRVFLGKLSWFAQNLGTVYHFQKCIFLIPCPPLQMPRSLQGIQPVQLKRFSQTLVIDKTSMGVWYLKENLVRP